MAPESRIDRDERAEVRALAERLKAVVEAAGGPKRVADLSDVPLRTLKSYTAGEADPKTTILRRIAEACRVSIDELAGNKLHEVGAKTGADLATPVDVVLVPKLNIRASAGPGLIPPPASDEQSLAFQRAWLRSLGVQPQNAEFLEADGDSMEPTIKSGDLMLVDRGYGQVVDGKIYVFVRDGQVLVKRVQKRALGGLVLISDNDRYPDQTVLASEMGDVHIAARVVWYGRAI